MTFCCSLTTPQCAVLLSREAARQLTFPYLHAQPICSGISSSAECMSSMCRQMPTSQMASGAQDERTQAQSWPLFTASCAPWHDLCPHGLGESWKYLLRWGRAEAVALGVRSLVERASEASAYTPTKRFLDSPEHERVGKKSAAYASS